jgi:hypothetical protein
VAAIRFYLADATVDGWQSLTTTPNAAATIPGGWVVGTGSTFSSEFTSGGTDRASTTFTGNTVPDGTLDTTLKDAFRTEVLNGTFASANWVFQFAVQSPTQGGAADGQIVFRLIKANADGSSPTLITAAQQTASVCTNVGATDVNSTLTVNPGAITLTNQYLFVQVAWKRTGAGGMTTTNIRLRTGSAATPVGTSILTANFVDTTPLAVTSAETLAVAELRTAVLPLLAARPVETVGVLDSVNAATVSGGPPPLTGTATPTLAAATVVATALGWSRMARDLFVDTPGTALTSHTPNEGSVWSQPFAYPFQIAASGTGLSLETASGFSTAVLNTTPLTANQAVEVVVVPTLSASVQVGLFVRYGFPAQTGYLLFATSGQVYLYRQDSGAYTFLVSAFVSVVAGDTLRLELVGSVLRGFVNGVQVITWTDATYSATGSAALYGDSVGAVRELYDHFRAYNWGGPLPEQTGTAALTLGGLGLTASGYVGEGPSGAWTLVASAGTAGAAHGATTEQVNTTGATLLVASVPYYVGGSPRVVTDTYSNTWVPLTPKDSPDPGLRLYYVPSPVVGPGHDFTVSGANTYSGLVVGAFSGGTEFGAENGTDNSDATATSLQPGAVTAANSVVVVALVTHTNTDFATAAAITDGFTILRRFNSAGTNYAHGLAYKIVPSGSVNPQWSWTTAYYCASVVAVFNAPAGPPADLEGTLTATLAAATLSATGTGPSHWTLIVAHTEAAYFAAGGVFWRSEELDTTGANLIAVFASGLSDVGPISDSEGNPWVGLPVYDSGDIAGRWYYCLNPTTSATHYFDLYDASAANIAYQLAIYAYAGAGYYDDRESGNALASGTAIQPGSETPSRDGCLVLTAVCYNIGGPAVIDGGFTIDASQALPSSGQYFGVAGASLVQGAAAAVNPQWTGLGPASQIITALVVFRPQVATAVVESVSVTDAVSASLIGAATLTIELLQGTTVIATWVEYPTETITEATLDLTTLQRDSITNWADLYVRFTKTDAQVAVTQVYLQTPEAAPITTLTVFVFDPVGTTDSVKTVVVPLAVHAADSVGVTELRKAVLPQLAVHAADLLTVTELRRAVLPQLAVHAADSVAVTESRTARLPQLAVHAADSVGVLDPATARVPQLAVHAADSVSVTELRRAVLPQLAVHASDAIGVTEARTVAATLLAARPVDVLTGLDSASAQLRTARLTATVADQVAVTESRTARLPQLAVHAAETLGVLDSVKAAPTLTVRVSESVAIAELRKAVLPQLAVHASDGLAVAEASTRRLQPLVLRVSESVGVTDALTVGAAAINASVAEAATVTDVATVQLRALRYTVSRAETLGVLDSAKAVAKPLAVHAVESSGVTERVTAALTLTARVSDSVTVAETRKAVLPQLAVHAADSVGVLDSRTARLPQLAVHAADLLTVAETRRAVLPQLAVHAVDTLTVTEARTASVQTVTGGLLRTEAVGVTDSATAQLRTVRLKATVSDSVSATDAVRRGLGLGVVRADSITVTESRKAVVPLVVRPAEAATVTDVVSVQVRTLRVKVAVADSVGVADSPRSVVRPLAVHAAETVGALDVVRGGAAVLHVDTADSVGTTDSVKAVRPQLVVRASDSVSATDVGTARVPALAARVADAIGTTDSTKTVIRPLAVHAAELVTVTDAPRGLQPLMTVQVAESISVETIAFSGFGQYVSDEVTVTEAVQTGLTPVTHFVVAELRDVGSRSHLYGVLVGDDYEGVLVGSVGGRLQRVED